MHLVYITWRRNLNGCIKMHIVQNNELLLRAQFHTNIQIKTSKCVLCINIGFIDALINYALNSIWTHFTNAILVNYKSLAFLVLL